MGNVERLAFSVLSPHAMIVPALRMFSAPKHDIVQVTLFVGHAAVLNPVSKGCHFVAAGESTRGASGGG